MATNNSVSKYSSRAGRNHGNWFHPTENYVFLNSLLYYPNRTEAKHLYSSTKALYHFDPGQNDTSAMQRFYSAISMLSSAAEAERTKEINFVMGQLKNHKELFENIYQNITPEMLIENPMLLEKMVNDAMMGYQQTERQAREILNNKKIRNAQALKNMDEVHIGGASASQVFGSTTVKNMIDAITGRGNHKANDLTAGIIKIVSDSGADLLGGKAFVAIASELQAYAEQAMGRIGIQEFNEETLMNDPNFKQFVEQKLKKISDTVRSHSRSSIQELSDFYSKRLDYLIGAKGGINQDIKRIRASENQTTQAMLDLGSFKGDKKMRRLRKMRKDLVNVDVAVKYGLGAEILSADRLAEIFKSALTGGSFIKTDVLKVCEFELNLTPNQTSQVEQLFQEMIDQKVSTANKQLMEQQQLYEEFYGKVERIISQGKKDLNDLGKMFIIHENIKDYLRLAIQGNNFEGYSGGTQWNGNSIAAYLDSLNSVGFNSADTDWVIAALINLNPHAVGGGSKSMLRDYLAGFAVSTLFSDGYLILQQVFQNASSYSPVQSLHLFNVNGVYRTSSYILSQIASNMGQMSGEVEKNVNVEIKEDTTDYWPEIISASGLHGLARWEDVRNQALQNTTISLRILSNFFEILEEMGYQ